ncbi:flavin reductase [Nocardioides sp. T5]|uniref:flavin reductase n=1 Tax=Nocardioides sp. T5 TaxID=3400182 RepID=UPI003A8552AA
MNKPTAISPTAINPSEYRRALGHYPTGVAVVAAQEERGESVGMVIGSFTSVSLDPPLVGFLVGRDGSTWPRLKEVGKFCVSVLGAHHEDVCRAFASKAPDRFTHASARSETGSPRIPDAALWVDCDLDAVIPAGDHDFVLGRVRDLGIGDDGGLPLLFLRGGYGAPRIASLEAQAPGLTPVLRLADLVRPEIEAVARDLGLECAVSAVVEGEVVILAAAGVGTVSGAASTHVGSTYPLVAPLSPWFVAWGSEAEQRRWINEGMRLAGVDFQALAWAQLEATRRRGYVAIKHRPFASRFQQLFLDRRGIEGGEGEALTTILLEAAENASDSLKDVDDLSVAATMHAPIRDQSGRTVLGMDLIGFKGDEDSDFLRRCRDTLLRATGRAAQLLSID